jgi:hypothetical protein
MYFLVICAVFVATFLSPAWSQDHSMGAMDMNGMKMNQQETLQLPSPHAGSGTAWEPASVPEHEWMLMRGQWELMAHGQIFIDYNQQGGPRGDGAKAESVNVGMLMEQHPLGAEQFCFARCFPRNR